MNFKHLFLPTPENDHTPHLLQRAAMAIMVALVLTSFVAVNLQALLWQSSKWLVGTILPAVVVDMTNTERQKLAEIPLKRNPVLDEAARMKAEDMAKNQYFSHYSPTGVSPWFWFDKVSYTFAHAGENLAIHFTDSGAVVDAWMNSPTHRANIVNSNYTEIGVGTAKGKFDGFDTVFVVQLFGTPAEAAAPAPVAQVAPTPAPIVVSTVASTTPNPVVAEIEDTSVQIAQTPKEEVILDEKDRELVAGEQIDSTTTKEAEFAPVAIEALPTAAPIEVAEVVKDNAQTSVFSTHFSTSSGLTPIVSNVSGSTAAKISVVGSIATQPSALLQIIYLSLGLMVALLLLISIIIGINNYRPLQVVYGVGLLLLMSGLFYVHAALTTNVVIAAEPTENTALEMR